MGKLTEADRLRIETLHRSGMKAAKIAEQLNRHKSSITRELDRNSVNGVYNYREAAKLATRRRSRNGRSVVLTEDHWSYVRVLLKTEWSPEQIEGWLKNNPGIGFTVSAKWIYEYIRSNHEQGGDLQASLRRAGKPYRNGKFRPYRGKIKCRVGIEERPEIVNKRIRIGDWEVDSVIGKLHKSSLVTLVERVSRYTVILKVNSKEADLVAKAIIARAKELKLKIHTITGDNGTEFADHQVIAEELGIDFFFTHPYSSWEKGTNENTNGLIRQYFPKGTDFNHVSDEAILVVEDKLNKRPRKCLDFRTPAEILVFSE